MEYYKLLNLNQEPFSNSPDPGLFFRSSRHAKCLQELEISLRLRRGLCVVSGEVGTGKTTICRHLLRSMSEDASTKIHMILDPSFESAGEMLVLLNRLFNGKDKADTCSTPLSHKEMIKDYLFKNGVDDKKTIILVIDEGQKLSSTSIEILRELLNYETNDQKLLQIIIFAQNEIEQILKKHHNFADRIGLFYKLLPLSHKDTSLFINYRLERSGIRDAESPTVHFTRRSIRLIYALTGGYPRKIINLCHSILLALIIKGAFKVTPPIVRKASSSIPTLNKPFRLMRMSWAVGAAVSVLIMLWLFMPDLRDQKARLSLAMFGAIDNNDENTEVMRIKIDENAYNDKVVPPEESPTSDYDIYDHEEYGPEPFEFTETAIPVDLDTKEEPQQEKPAVPSTPAILTIPSTMGLIEVRGQTSLWKIISRIYGSCSLELLKKVVKSNPTMKNPDIIRMGQRIFFPVIKVRAPFEKEKYWIKAAGFSLLDEAYRMAIEESSVSLRVLGLWDERIGFEFHVVATTSFRDKEAALKGLEMLPADALPGAEVLFLDKKVSISGL
jgi:general secretion pathway protein A